MVAKRRATDTPRCYNIGTMSIAVKHIRPLSCRQTRAIDLWLKNGRKSKARAIREAGYSEAIAHQPHKVFGSHAVRDELKRLGVIKEEIQESKIKAVELVPLDFSKMSTECIEALGARLAEIPDIPAQQVNFQKNENEIGPYTPTGNCVDIFNQSADESSNSTHTKSRLDNFSSM